MNRVAVLIPHMGEMSTEFADKCYGPLKYTPSPHFEKRVLTCKGLPIHIARNILANNALQDDAVTHMLWLDSDIIPESPGDINEMLHRLMLCDASIASGVYRARQKHGFNYAMWKNGHEDGKFIPVIEWTGNWIEVTVIGMGICLMKREVFETVPPPWFEWYNEAPSEDFNACLKFAKAGYKIMVFTDARCSHISGQLKVLSTGEVTTLDI